MTAPATASFPRPPAPFLAWSIRWQLRLDTWLRARGRRLLSEDDRSRFLAYLEPTPRIRKSEGISFECWFDEFLVEGIRQGYCGADNPGLGLDQEAYRMFFDDDYTPKEAVAEELSYL